MLQRGRYDMFYDTLRFLDLLDGDLVFVVDLLVHFLRLHVQVLFYSAHAFLGEFSYDAELHYLRALSRRKPCQRRCPLRVGAAEPTIVEVFVKQRQRHHVAAPVVLERHFAQGLDLLPVFPLRPLERELRVWPAVVLAGVAIDPHVSEPHYAASGGCVVSLAVTGQIFVREVYAFARLVDFLQFVL